MREEQKKEMEDGWRDGGRGRKEKRKESRKGGTRFRNRECGKLKNRERERKVKNFMLNVAL